MKILIVDDSSLSRNMFKRALGDQYSYIEAQDGMQGLEKYFLEKPDLVILDLTMPGTNGMEILSQIKQLDPAARVVIGTADVQSYSRQQAEKLGALAFITKPFTEESVKNVVKSVLES